MTARTTDWLSAQQAVQPDGTESTNLPLINKVLPPLGIVITEEAAMRLAKRAGYFECFPGQICTHYDGGYDTQRLTKLIELAVQHGIEIERKRVLDTTGV